MIHRSFTLVSLLVFFILTAAGQTGQIAYVRGNTEIRVIKPDGSGDRQLWTHPDLNQQLGIV